jgi:predicted esterase
MMIEYCTVDKNLQISFVGPSFEKGPLPALFYFALSADESLQLDPFNQLVQFSNIETCRIFSLTLPGHGPGLDPTQALIFWAEEIEKGHRLIEKLIEQIAQSVDYLQDKGMIASNKLAVSGLSRGAFIATHAAAHIPSFRTLLGFAPLTKLSFAKEFRASQNPARIASLDLIHLVDRLTDRKVRFYIGNHDTRVGTANCFQWIEALSNAAFDKNIRSPQVELIIGPSIGHLGHGTGPHVFQDGAHWAMEQLEVQNV